MNLTKNQIEIMLEMQTASNALIDPDWREKKHPYLRAAMIEAAEAMDHLGYKWWKATKEDIKQAQMELVDIWHFALSDYLVSWNSTCHQASIIVICELDEFEDEIYFCPDISSSHDIEPDYKISECETILDKLDLFIACCGIRTFNMSLFVSIMEDVGMTQQDLFIMYIAKNVLNEFRQNNGYKSGDYVKNWNGREDNEHLEEFMGVVDPTEPNYADLLRGMLSERYKTVVKSIDECYINRGES